MIISRRAATPYITTLDCECGGDYRVIQNHRLHFQDEISSDGPTYFAHQCNKCKKTIWVKNASYPMQTTAVHDTSVTRRIVNPAEHRYSI